MPIFAETTRNLMLEDKTIEKVDFNEQTLDDSYYNCVFKACDFTKMTLPKVDFDNCLFEACDFSLCKFRSSLRDTTFRGCKVVGADFVELNRFSNGLVFEDSNLNYANFADLKLRKTSFKNCTIQEAVFDNSELCSSVFDRCDLSRTSFYGANLEKVDFSKSNHFSINPTTCHLKNAIFSEADLRGLLDHLNIVIRPVGEL